MEQHSHTPTPWTRRDNLLLGGGKRLCATFNYGGTAKANAAFIVKAVNMHDELVEALRAYCSLILSDYELQGGGVGGGMADIYQNLTDLLAREAQS